MHFQLIHWQIFHIPIYGGKRHFFTHYTINSIVVWLFITMAQWYSACTRNVPESNHHQSKHFLSININPQKPISATLHSYYACISWKNKSECIFRASGDEKWRWKEGNCKYVIMLIRAINWKIEHFDCQLCEQEVKIGNVDGHEWYLTKKCGTIQAFWFVSIKNKLVEGGSNANQMRSDMNEKQADMNQVSTNLQQVGTDIN